VFSALLFASTIVPAALETPWPGALLAASLVASAVVARPLARRRTRGFAMAGALRVPFWLLAVVPVVPSTGPRLFIAAFSFGLMAGGIRRALYRLFLGRRDAPAERDPPDARKGRLTAASLRLRLAESAMVAGIVGGHLLLLLSVAFLRTQSRVIYQGWHDVVPLLALLGTVGFTLAIRPATSAVVAALVVGPGGDRAALLRGLAQARELPGVLAAMNFVIWSLCTGIGVFYFRTGPASWSPGDAVMQLGFGLLISWGVSFYQRAWHRDELTGTVDALRAWTGTSLENEEISLQRRLLRDFGLPLVFTAALSLLSTIGLYRALAPGPSITEDFNAVTALFASFALLVIAAGGVVARAARDMSRPMSRLAEAADLVARGRLDEEVPPVGGPVEVVALGASVERMRSALARTIAELEEERRGLEANVESRTAELRRALDELKRAQAALVQGERMATIGELVAGVAHEIHNPLNAIAGSVEPLERIAEDLRSMLATYREAEAELPEARRRALADERARLDLDGTLDDLRGISSVVRRATGRSVSIVANLRSFSRASGEATPADLHAGIDETLLLLGPRLRDADVTVERRFGELPPVVCRPGEINQVFMNLLTNAIHALEGAGVSRPVPSGGRVIRVETRVEGDLAVVAVEDSGPGVPEALATRIFDPFFTTKPRGEGTGLGLSISTDIVRRHGGALSLEAAPEGGARFVCRIPISGGPGDRPKDARQAAGAA
jgi:signal transduction histidine kinase